MVSHDAKTFDIGDQGLELAGSDDDEPTWLNPSQIDDISLVHNAFDSALEHAELVSVALGQGGMRAHQEVDGVVQLIELKLDRWDRPHLGPLT